MTAMLNSQTAASLVEVATTVRALEVRGEDFGPEVNRIWFFLRNRSELLLSKERDDVYALLSAVGPVQAVRMTGYLVEHADEPASRLFWEGAHEFACGLEA